jgi:hypothetical protein
LVYTGDTGYDGRIKDAYEKIFDEYGENKIVLLAHIGGFKEYEQKFDASKTIKENESIFYTNHLGRLGLARLVEILKPKVCIISEFGEEFRKMRIDLCRIYQDVYNGTKFIPADIGLKISSKCKVELIDLVDIYSKKIKHSFYPCDEVSVCEHLKSNSLKYYNGKKVKETTVLQYF